MIDQTQQDQTFVQTETVQTETEYGPRRLNFFILVLKTFAGLFGGLAGAAVFLLIFLGASSVLQPAVGSVVDATSAELSPLFMVVVLAMMLATSMVSNILGVLFLSYTERDRYNRVSTALVQVFIVNLVIFGFVVPVYLTTSTSNLELTVYAACLQLILSATASALILELIHDYKYSLLAVYNTILAVLAASAFCFILYSLMGNATIMMFVVLPIIWASIGFFQGAITMIYNWIFRTWGNDFLASYASFGSDYGIPDQSEEEEEEALRKPDVSGSDFLKQ